MMSDEEIKKLYAEMENEYGNKLPNPDHCPKTFAYYVRLYLHFKQIREKNEKYHGRRNSL